MRLCCRERRPLYRLCLPFAACAPATDFATTRTASASGDGAESGPSPQWRFCAAGQRPTLAHRCAASDFRQYRRLPYAHVSYTRARRALRAWALLPNRYRRAAQCYQAFRTTALAALRLLAVLIVLSASARLASAVVRNSYGTRAVKFDFDLIIAGAGPVGLSVARLLAQRSATRALSVALVDQHAITPVG